MGKREIVLCMSLMVLPLGMKVQCRPKPDLSKAQVARSVLAKCSNRMQIKFPTSTRLINFAEEHGQDYTAYLKVEIEASDLPFLIENSPFVGRQLEGSSCLSTIGPGDWWNHDSVGNLESGQVRLPPGGWESLSILIDFDRPGRPVLYLEFSGRRIL